MANEWRCCGCGTEWGDNLADPACRCATAFTYQREVKGSLRSKVDHLAPLESAGAPRGRVVGHSRVEGAEKAQGLSAARTGGASDLPELRSQEELDQERRVPIWAWPVAAFKALLWGLGLGRLL